MQPWDVALAQGCHLSLPRDTLGIAGAPWFALRCQDTVISVPG